MVNRKRNNRTRNGGNKEGEGRFSPFSGLPRFSPSEWEEWKPYLRMTLLVMLIPIVAFQGYLYFTKSSHFTLRNVEISGNSRLTQPEILGFLEVQEGQSLFELNEEEIAQNLERHPRIRHAEVRVDIPDRLYLHIEERAAAAAVVLDTLFLADERGVVFKPMDPRDDIEGLPIISGISRERLENEATVKAAEMVIREGIDLSVVYASHEVARLKDLGELHHDPLFGWTLMTAKDGMEIRLGTGQFRQKLDRLVHILRDLEARGARAEIVRLDSSKDPDRVAVRMHYPEEETRTELPSDSHQWAKGVGSRNPPPIRGKIPLQKASGEKKRENHSKLDEILGN